MLNQAERKYSTYDRELLAAYSAIKHFRYLLEGRKFTLYTDHKPLTFALQQKQEKASPRQFRHLDFVAQYTTDIRHISGKQNIVADTLSRIEALTFPSSLDYELLAKNQVEDPELKSILKSETSLVLKRIRLPNTKDELYCDLSTGSIRPFITQPFRRRVFENYHNLCHPSIRNTVKYIRSKFVWPAISRDIRRWSRSCLTCQQNKVTRHVSSPLQKFAIPEKRFNQVHIDIVGPLQPSLGFTYCVTCIDRFTRWPEVFPVSDIQAETIATAFFNGWVSRFGTPEFLITDQGTQFESSLFKSFCNILGIKRNRTTAYHPQSNGMVERFHRSLKAAIRCHEKKGWAECLPLVLLGFRSVFREDLNSTAAELVYGSPISLPGELIYTKANPICTEHNFVEKLRDHMNNLKPIQTQNHGNRPTFIFQALPSCSLVFVRRDASRSSLQSPYEGPYRVIERFKKYYSVEIRGKSKHISIDRLKPAFTNIENPETDIQKNSKPNLNLSHSDTQNNKKSILQSKQTITKSGRVVRPNVRFQT